MESKLTPFGRCATPFLSLQLIFCLSVVCTTSCCGQILAVPVTASAIAWNSSTAMDVSSEKKKLTAAIRSNQFDPASKAVDRLIKIGTPKAIEALVSVGLGGDHYGIERYIGSKLVGLPAGVGFCTGFASWRLRIAVLRFVSSWRWYSPIVPSWQPTRLFSPTFTTTILLLR